jgi:hypothetical protein
VNRTADVVVSSFFLLGQQFVERAQINGDANSSSGGRRYKFRTQFLSKSLLALLLLIVASVVAASDFDALRKQRDIDRATYWKQRGYTFDPQFMTAYAMDQKVKDIERANYWKQRGYTFDPQFMTAYAMNQKVKDIERANYWKQSGYTFDPQFMTAYAMDQKVKETQRANSRRQGSSEAIVRSSTNAQTQTDSFTAAIPQLAESTLIPANASIPETGAVFVPLQEQQSLKDSSDSETLKAGLVSAPALTVPTTNAESDNSAQPMVLTTNPIAPYARLSSPDTSAGGAAARTGVSESDAWTRLLLIAATIGVIIFLIRLKTSRSSGRQAPHAEVTEEVSQRERIINCPNCGQRNRVPENHGRARFRCGSCHTELLSPFISNEPPSPEPIPTYRPSTTQAGNTDNIAFNDNAGNGHPVTPIDLEGLVDAFTGEALNTSLGLYQCGKCEVFYHRASFDVILNENAGKCVSCLSTSIRSVSPSPTQTEARPAKGTEKSAGHARGRATTNDILNGFRPRQASSNFRPDAVTLFNYREHLDRVVTFQGQVRKVLVSRRGTDFALMFENVDWTAGFKVVVFNRHLRAVGGPTFLRALDGKTVRARGLVQHNKKYGWEIVVSERSMLQEVQ